MTTTAGDTASILDLEFTRGDDWELEVEFVDDETGDPLNWSGSTFAAQIRQWEDGPLAAQFDVDMTLWVSQSRLTLSLAKEVTTTLGRGYAWDLERTDVDGLVSTPLKGTFTVQLDVTKVEGS